jgi:hypothetical protein
MLFRKKWNAITHRLVGARKLVFAQNFVLENGQGGAVVDEISDPKVFPLIFADDA